MAASVTKLLIILALWANQILAYGSSCEEQGLLSCELTKECFKVEERCNSVWDCKDRSDEAECSTNSVITKEGHLPYNTISKGQNLAWLVTPILLLLGAAYGIYKCVKDGVCAAIKRRVLHGRRNRAENRASDYHPLHQVSFYTSTQIPCTQLGINPTSLTPQQQQMMLVHNQSFSIQIPGQGVENPGAEGGVLPMGTSLPPTYDEAMSAISDGKGGAIVMMKNGQVINIQQMGMLPPAHNGNRGSHTMTRPAAAAASAQQMEAIEEEEEQEEEEEEDNPDTADEETFFLPKDTRGDGNVGGRRRHNSQWSNKRRSESRRRHHSCPS